eukprot:scaffold3201_cov116-Isochrysis_galbana.AAC.11
MLRGSQWDHVHIAYRLRCYVSYNTISQATIGRACPRSGERICPVDLQGTRLRHCLSGDRARLCARLLGSPCWAVVCARGGFRLFQHNQQPVKPYGDRVSSDRDDLHTAAGRHQFWAVGARRHREQEDQPAAHAQPVARNRHQAGHPLAQRDIRLPASLHVAIRGICDDGVQIAKAAARRVW